MPVSAAISRWEAVALHDPEDGADVVPGEGDSHLGQGPHAVPAHDDRPGQTLTALGSMPAARMSVAAATSSGVCSCGLVRSRLSGSTPSQWSRSMLASIAWCRSRGLRTQ
jgi:hypothetical protein